MGRTAHVAVRPTVDHPGMDPRGMLHRIEDDLTDGWLDEWIDGGVLAIEDYLAKHLAFLCYLDRDEASA
jgi:hypothetical protein